MAKIRKLNVSEITGPSPYTDDTDAVMPSGTVVVYENTDNGVTEYVLRVHDGVTNGGIALGAGESPVIFNGSDGIVRGNLDEGIAALFNNGEVYITGGESLRFTGLSQFEGDSTPMLRFWDNEGRHSTSTDATELVTLNVGNDAAEGDPTEGFFKIITEKEADPDNNKEWKFDSNGVLTLPTGGDIVDSTGASVLGGGGGDANIWIQTFASADGYPGDVVVLASSVEYDNAGNIIALFSHQTGIGEFNVPSGSYFSVAKFTAAGQKLWQVRLAADMGTGVYTDGWGLAVDNVDSRIYVAGRVDDEANYSKSSLIKLDSEDGSLIWSNVYDFGAGSDSPVVDVDSEGNPIVVGFYSTEVDTNDGVTVTKINSQDGTVVWSRLLDGQNDDEAYGMAVGPNNEVVAIGYTAQIGLVDTAETLSADPVSNANWTVNQTGVFSGFEGIGIQFDVSFTAGVPTFSNIVDTAGGRVAEDTVATILGSALGGVNGTDDMIVKVATVTAGDTDDRMLVVKYDSTGTIQWQKAIQFEEGYDCYGADADIDSQGNVYVCGSYEYAGDGDTNSAMHLVKFDSSGVKQWSRRVAGPCEDFATSIVVGPDDTLYLSGVTGTFVNDSPRYVWVVAKYTTSGTVVWQRLIENTTGWTFGGAGFFSSAGGSNLAVGEGYVALSGGFGEPLNNNTAATLVQIDEDGTVFNIGDWEFKAASFSGTLSSDASDITVINAGKTDSDMASGIDINSTLFDIDTTDFLIPTLYSAGGAGSELTNGEYTFALGSTGTVTLPAGGTITEGVVTSNPTIQLTPASPTVASQKLVIKGGGAFSAEDNGIFLTWNEINPLVSDTVEIYVNSPDNASQTLYWWIEPADVIADPGFGTVEIDGSGNGVFTFTVDSDDYEFTVRVSPEDNNYDPDSIGVETQAFNADSPTYGDHHLHLTTGDLTETSIFLGTDDHNVRTTTDGAVKITSRDYIADTSYVWQFSEGGNLTLPAASADFGGSGQIFSNSGTNFINLDVQFDSDILGGMRFGTQADTPVDIWAGSDSRWRFGSDGSLTVPGAITQGDAKLSFNENNSTNVYLTPTTDDTSAVFINAVGSQVYGKETVSILGGAGVQAALDLFHENRQLLRDLFDQLQGEPGFPWGITQPAGGDTYDELLSLPSDTFPNQTTAIARANSLNQAYSTYQTLYNNSEVTLAVGDQSWRIDSEGFLNAPNQRFIRFYDEQGAFNGAIGGDNIDHVVFNAGANKGIKVFTDDGTKLWTFGADGALSLPANGVIKSSTYSGFSLRSRYDEPIDNLVGSNILVSPGQVSINYQVEDQGVPTPGYQWDFNYVTQALDLADGGLKFADNTVQTTAYVPADNLVKVSDEWSVTTGTNTYSFTVPSDGTYVMWVKGNIPNGIITWNATVSVSNTNVPAIGTQYAWNYTGGGSPILLTSIPDQIKGVDGTISTDATYAGTTSNRFDFGISNTSGSTQTVYYGYTKVS